MSLQSLPDVPLRRLLDFLPVKTGKNLLLANRCTQLGIDIKNMSRKKSYICPSCVFDKEVMNAIECLKQKPDSDVDERYKEFDAFCFFNQFKVAYHGCWNYIHEFYEIDIDTGAIRTKLERNPVRKSIAFLGSENFPSRNWWNIIDMIEKKEMTSGSMYMNEKRRVEQIFLGGSSEGVTIKPTLKLYTRHEFERHILTEHDIDEDLNLQEFWIWCSEWANPYSFLIPPSWYNSNLQVCEEQLEQFILKVAIARYYRQKHYTSTEEFARRLRPANEQIMLEILDVFKYACDAFDKLKFPVQYPCMREQKIFKFYDLGRRTLQAIYE